MYDTDNIPLVERLQNIDGLWEGHGLMHDQMPFQETVGPNLPLEVEDPLTYFYCLFSEEFIDNLVFHTNLYAHQKQKTFESATS